MLEQLFGWSEAHAPDAFEALRHEFAEFEVVGAQAPRPRVALWDAVRKVLGHDTPNYAQQVGDCVSFGAKNVIEYLACQQIALGNLESFHPVHPPYLYGCGRMVGDFQIRGDGSVGSWQAVAVKRYGTLRSDFQGVPEYSGDLARRWGAPPGPPATFIDEGDDHLVRQTAPVTTVDDAVTAIDNHYPLTIASNVGFTMEPKGGDRGFHEMRGSWSHQMCVVFYSHEPELHFGILNSWGDVHGHLVDLVTGEPWPVGMLRVRASALERILSQGDSHVYSHLDGFAPQRLTDFGTGDFL